ncbi:phage holin family protein [Parageobacillus thermoglucosidasius]|uniref:Holin n=1 Tax=Parageobacillus thermoglucosidasius TaxID=1426 RepID=A0AAN0YNM0_PARTM|nr:phage holin family protein [Parageobacillus thermoglucosidasius]ALF10467.1 holin [Parageobacillus thermoglucosidasius]ANZ30547.1 holin [Parageobacillus thermoglucosidasius]APM81285.1 holin [Parageobacillus thermoglucosidasius]KJX68150.1 holin [Parageobacillus thermoglucosidasius]RDE21875.1 holin [Parageobacillus thermoglucosidasius]
MERLDVAFKTGAATIGGMVVFFFGGWMIPLRILVSLSIVDYVSGLIAGAVEKKLSSKVGFKIAKKVMMFTLVATGNLVDIAIGKGHVFRDAVIFFYMGNEILSILESAGRIGLPIPEQLRSAIEILKGKEKRQR